MKQDELIEAARSSIRRQAWSEAFARLEEADELEALEARDLADFAVVAHLIGRDAKCTELWTRAHHSYLTEGDAPAAVRCAFWLAFGLARAGEGARASGWFARAQRILDDEELDCPERGYLLMPKAIQLIAQGNPGQSHDLMAQAAEIGRRYGDRDLVVYARHGQGRAMIRMGKIEEGIDLLDEAMAAIEAGDVSPLIVGDIYCSVLEACREIFDLRRAHEWTGVLTQWCESQPDLVPYRGQCQVRRSEILQLHGSWLDALDEAIRACASLSRPPGVPAAGAAFYQKAELHRLRGEFDEAEDAYREAGKWSRKPRPGFALLRLAQGDSIAAEAAITRLMEGTDDMFSKSEMLPAYVQIMLARNDTAKARAAADEFAVIADRLDASFLRALSAYADGAVCLAEGDPRAALAPLRRAWTDFTGLEAPYEAALVRILLAVTCRALGDEEGARLDLEAARETFVQLGAVPDLARVDALMRGTATGSSHGLSTRELEVLHLIAAGEANKSIAANLFISERTVERHVSNIFAKLEVSSRTAAAAFAFEHGLT